MSTTSEKSEKPLLKHEPSLQPSLLKITKKEVWIMKEIAMDLIKDLKAVPGPFELSLMALNTYLMQKGFTILDIAPLMSDYVENTTQYECNEE